MLIDPRLLLDGERSIYLDEQDIVTENTAAERLESLIYNDIDILDEDEQAIGLDIFLENVD